MVKRWKEAHSFSRSMVYRIPQTSHELMLKAFADCPAAFQRIVFEFVPPEDEPNVDKP